MQKPDVGGIGGNNRSARDLFASSMIIRQKEPVNLETPFHEVGSFLTPAESFYVRNHFSVPQIDAGSYRLRIDGAVRSPVTFSYDELKAMPSEKCVAALECAGNSRVFLVPQAEGAQWELGAVGNAEWTGVPLRFLLERAGIKEEACEIVLEGADQGTPKEKPTPPGKISYARSLQREKALTPEVLIAYEMNGRDLLPDHGYPVRAIVPGHYGMASVKWLTHVHAVVEPFHGYWQTSDYAYWDYIDGKPVRRALGEMAVKSQISRPGIHQVLAVDAAYTIKGAAWAGETDVSDIFVSTDDGQTWLRGEWTDPVQRYAWRRWKCEWRTPEKPGSYTLQSRAVAADGTAQPERHNENFGNYVINYQLPIEVFVR